MIDLKSIILTILAAIIVAIVAGANRTNTIAFGAALGCTTALFYGVADCYLVLASPFPVPAAASFPSVPPDPIVAQQALEPMIET